MDRQLLERMIGAAVLIVFLIVVVPAVLDSPGDIQPSAPVAVEDSDSMRQVTIRPMAEADTPPLAKVRDPVDDQQTAQGSPKPPAKVESPVNSSGPEATAKPPSPAVVKPPATPKPKPIPAEPKPAPAPAAAPGWIVQLGSFANQKNAQALAEKLRDAGFQGYLLPLQRDGKTLFRVRVGPASEARSGAEKLAARLRTAGHAGSIMRQEP